MRALRIAVVVLLLAITSWMTGLFVYAWVVQLAFGEVASTSDWQAVKDITFYIYFPYVFILHVPALAWLINRSTGASRYVLVPLGAAIAGIVPTMAIGAGWPEALLFLALFASASALFALGFAIILPRLQQS